MNREQFESWKVLLFIESPIDVEYPNEDICVEYYVYVLTHLDYITITYWDVIEDITEWFAEYLDEIIEKSNTKDKFMTQNFLTCFTHSSAMMSELFVNKFLYNEQFTRTAEELNEIAESSHNYLLKKISIGVLLNKLVDDEDLCYISNLNLFDPHIDYVDLGNSGMPLTDICDVLIKHNITPPVNLFINYFHRETSDIKAIECITKFDYHFTSHERRLISDIITKYNYNELKEHFTFLQSPKYPMPDTYFTFI